MSDILIEKVSLPFGQRVPLIVAFGLRISHPHRWDVAEAPGYDFTTQRTNNCQMAGKSTSRDDESRGITLFNSRPDTRQDD
jgi:hypothetical protein